MKAGWKTKRLGELGSAVRESAQVFANTEYELWSVPSFASDEPEIAIGKDIGSAKLRVRPNDVLICKINPRINRVWLVREPANGRGQIASTEWLVLRINPDAGLLPSWLIHFVSAPKFRQWIASEVSGATGSHTRAKADGILQQQIPVPPLPEQRRIVGILDEAFEGIATAKANAEKNLQNARALFESGLDSAITGKLTQDWRRAYPNTESAAMHLRGKLAQRRSHWKGTGRYKEPAPPGTNKPLDIPNSWTLASPEQIATHIVDCPHSTPKWAKSGVLCLRTTNFKPGFLDLESVQFVSKETYHERIMRLEPKPGDILYSREGGILGIACIIPKQLKTCLGQRMMLFRLDTTIALPGYFAGVLNSALILSEVKRLTGGAASPHLNIRDIRTFPIPLPPIAEQKEIVAKLEALTAETQRLASLYQQKLAALEALKKSLLHQAFTGEL